MKLRITTEYEAEEMTPQQLLQGDRNMWMESLDDKPMYVATNTYYIAEMHPKRKVFGLTFIEDKVEVVE